MIIGLISLILLLVQTVLLGVIAFSVFKIYRGGALFHKFLSTSKSFFIDILKSSANTGGEDNDDMKDIIKFLKENLN